MAPTKKRTLTSSSKTRSSSSKDVSLKKVKGENFYRNAKQAARAKMLTGGKAVRDKDGNVIKAAAFQKGESEANPGRVQPDRRWFGNTRVISQTALDHFRTSLSTKKDDPYSVLLRRNKLPMALLDDAAKPNIRKRSHIVETEPFSETFGPKAQRKRPRLDVGTFEELGKVGGAAAERLKTSRRDLDSQQVLVGDFQPVHADYIEPIFAKGTSRRIYGELYKVIDSSDVILHILDARDPLGTMCESGIGVLEEGKGTQASGLVPNWVTARYIQHLTPRYPTIAFHASPNHSFGKGSLIQLLRQFSQLHSDKKQISVGFVGYPNVGKSSVINTLKSGKVCRVAPIPGETKVWQYITLTRRIYLIDCPGIVPTSAHDSQTSTVLKGVVRVEALPTPSEHIPALMERVKPLYLSRTYDIPLPDPDDLTHGWDPEQFLNSLAKTKGRLLKGGEPDVDGVAKIILTDWVRGRIPFFVPPPERSEELNIAEAKLKAKGKAKTVVEEKEEKEVVSVKQNLNSIIQKNTFLAEDMRPLEGEAGANEAALSGEDSFEGQGVSEDTSDADGDPELSWNDVFEEEGHTNTAIQSAKGDASTDEESPMPPKKEPRMKTSKKRAENFYTNVNVKNKNRGKAALLKSLPAGKKGEGRKRR
ncbi:NGP1NT-domain-containing protein [Lanmaoa asiatica]|nr:NGP1NT-domain-containing protein [Lanmaoa asiatica]